MQKRKWLPVIAAACTVFLAAGGLYAYFTSAEKAENKMQIANVHTTITEEFPPKEGPIYKKSVSVLNDGKSPCYTRVFVGFTSDKALQSTGFGYSKDGPWYAANPDLNAYDSQDGTFSGTFAEQLLTEDNGWTYVPLKQEMVNFGGGFTEEDQEFLGGWYYYSDKLEPGSSTAPLFTHALTQFKDPDDAEEFDLFVYCESVQTKDGFSHEYETNPESGPAWYQAWSDFIRSIPDPE